MLASRKLGLITSSFSLLILLAMSGLAVAQRPQSLDASAKGEGTLSVGKEKFKLYTVVVKLKEGGEAQITVVSDLSLFVSGEWSAGDDISKGVELKITGGTSQGSASGTGKLFLTADGKGIARLTLQGVTRSSGQKYTANFVAAQ
jgi:hypothetical protein